MFNTEHSKVCYAAKDLDTGLRVRQFDDSGKPEKGKGELAPDHVCDAYEYGLTREVSSEPAFLELWQLGNSSWRNGKIRTPDAT